MKLDVSMLDELVREYCVYRGIVDSGLASPPGESIFAPTFMLILSLNFTTLYLKF